MSNNEVGAAYVSIYPNTNNFSSNIVKSLNGVNLSGVGNKLGTGLGGAIGNGLSASKVALGNILSNVVSSGMRAISSSIDSAGSRVDTLNNFPRVMANMGISSEAAAASISKLSGDALRGLPTTLDAAASAVQRLTSVNGDVGKSTDYFLALNNAVIAGGASAAIQSTAIEQLSQSYSKGKMDMMEWRSLQTAMPAQLNQVAKAMGVTSDALGEGLRNGTISMDAFMDTLVRLNSEGIEGFESFENQARAAVGGIGTQVSNMGTAVTRSVAKVVDAFNSAGAITKALSGITGGIDALGKAVAPVAEAVGTRLGNAIDYFGSSLEATGNPLRAFYGSLLVAFDDTPVLGFIRAFRGYIDALAGGANPVTVLKRAWSDLASFLESQLGAALDFVKDKLSALPQPIQDAASAIGSFISQNGTTIAGSALFGAAVAGLSGPVSTLVGAVSRAVPFFQNLAAEAVILASRFLSVNGGVAGVGKLLLGLAGPVGIAVVVVSALAAGFAYLMATNEDFRATVMGLVGDIAASLMPALQAVAASIAGLVSSVMPSIQAAMQAILPVIGQVITLVLQVAAALAPLVAIVVSTVVPILAQLVAVVVEVVSTIIAAVMPVIEQILQAVRAAMPGIQSAVEAAMSAIMAVVQAVWPAIQAVIETVMGVIQGVISAASAAIRGDWQGFWNAVKGIAQSVWNGIKSLVSSAMHAVSSVISSVMSAVGGAWNGAWNSVKSTVSNAWTAIKATVQAGIDGMFGFIQSIPGRILGVFSNAGNLLVDAGRSIIDGLTSGIRGAIGGVQDLLSSVTSLIPSWKGPEDVDKKLLIPSGELIMRGLTVGIGNGLSGLRATLGGVTSYVSEWNYGTFAPAQAGGNAGMAAEIAALRRDMRNMQLALNINGREFARVTVGDMSAEMARYDERRAW